MASHLIKLSDSLAVNPAHVAYATRESDGITALHMALASIEGAEQGEPLPSHPVLFLNDQESAAWWAAAFQGRG